MGVVAIPGSRVVFRDSPEGLAMTIPATRNLLMLFFVGLWMVGWAIGAGMVLRQLLGETTLHFGSVFLVVWLAGWTVGGAVAARSWLWTAFGKERIVLRPATLSVKRDVLGVGRERRYDLPLVSNLRIVPASRGARDRSSRPESPAVDRVGLAFDYGPETVHFAGGLDEAEAAYVIERLKARHAFR
jgi:hypothetical protein